MGTAAAADPREGAPPGDVERIDEPTTLHGHRRPEPIPQQAEATAAPPESNQTIRFVRSLGTAGLERRKLRRRRWR
ncbi:MAG TPA: hypothetical protein DCQ98_15870 [Planctomycetaceae bacterium]|nr:hypothetical protein [Planctomycetaceae bacterium]